MLLRINKPADREAVKQYIDRLPETIRYTVTVERVKSQRSIDQNRLYWMWLSCISDETGNDLQDLHAYFAGRYLTPESVIVFGIEVDRVKSTTKLDTAQFTAYLDKIEIFASMELGIILPRPEDLHFAEMAEKYRI